MLNQQRRNIKEMKKFIVTTLSGMTYGIFATIVAGTILKQLGILLNIEVLTTAVNTRLSMLLGAAIGVSIAMSLKLTGLKFMMLVIAGGIATSFATDFSQTGWHSTGTNNPVTIYFVVILTYFALQVIFKKPTAYDLFLIPLVSILISVLATYIVSWPVERMMEGIYWSVKQSMNIEPYTTSAILSLVFGVLLTVPFISSAAVAIAVFGLGSSTDPLVLAATAAAVVGTTTQMIGFAYQSRKNDAGTIISIGLASSMFQFKNITKKPVIWGPTLMASAILGPINYAIFNPLNVFKSTGVGAGMGTSGLVGQLETLMQNNYSGYAWLFIAAQIILPLILVALFDYMFLKKGWYEATDFQISQDL